MSIIATSMRTVTTSSGTLAIQRRRVNARIVRARAARCQAARRLTSCAKRRGIDAAGACQARGGAMVRVVAVGVVLVPYLVRDYAHAYKMFNGEIGKSLDEQFQRKYRLKILLFFDYGFRHFWNNKRPIAKPDDLKGLKLRVQQGKVFADTVNGLGANAVPMSWSEVVPAAQQGVIDGADLPIVNINALKIYEVSRYASMTFHNYGPSLVVMNLDSWKSLVPEAQRLLTEVSREAQARVREATESVDNLQRAREIQMSRFITTSDGPKLWKVIEA